MNKKILKVPSYVNYISDWKEFEYPQGHLILDKTICGCGFTEWCLINNIPLILCSPRKTLLGNKKNQHLDDENIYYFKNEYTIENYDTDKPDLTPEEKIGYLIELKDNLNAWLLKMTIQGKVPKILVTYDSLHHVLDALGSGVSRFAIVVDEFQAVFLDAAFKADVEFRFIEDLENCPNVLYLSATPMLDKYLDDLDYFKDLDFFKLEWPRSKVENIRIERRIVGSINKEVSDLIEDYRGGKFPNKIINGELNYSKELVIFVNSVKSICDIIRKAGLKPEETNIICSDTADNRAKLKKVKHEIGEVPLKGKPHKMFTLCTRTTYLGSDFYSTSAYTVICSDSGIKTLTVDISLDLPQIVGRQRLKENVFRNEVLFLYKATTKKEASINISEEEFKEHLEKKINETKKLLEGYDRMTEEQKRSWSTVVKDRKNLYQNDFLGVSEKSGKAVFNNLVKIANQRAYDVTRKEYQDIVTIRRSIESLDGFIVEDDYKRNNEIVDAFVSNFTTTGNFDKKMELLCCFIETFPQYYESYYNFLYTIIPREYETYIGILGITKIRALQYEELKIKNYIETESKLDKNKEGILSLFKIGNRYSLKDIKLSLSNFYQTRGIQKTPKASDLEEYFKLKEVKVLNKETGKLDRGYEILKLKD